MTTSGFLFTWTPYAVNFFVSAFQGKDYDIPPMATFFSACFAKTSVIWIPLFYISTSSQFQFSVVNQDALLQTTRTTRIGIAATDAAATGCQKNNKTANNLIANSVQEK